MNSYRGRQDSVAPDLYGSDMNRLFFTLIFSFLLFGCTIIEQAEPTRDAPLLEMPPLSTPDAETAVTPTLAPQQTPALPTTSPSPTAPTETAPPPTSAPIETVRTVLRRFPPLQYSNDMDSAARRFAAIEATTELEQWLIDAWAFQATPDEVRGLLIESGYMNQETDIIEADIDGDGRNEWLFTLLLDANQPYQHRYGDFWIVDNSGVRFRYYSPEAYFSHPAFLDRAPIATAVADFTGDGTADLLLNTGGCGAHTCWDGWQFFTAHDGRFENRITKTDTKSAWGGTYLFYAQPDSDTIEMTFAESAIIDINGRPHLSISGGQVGSAGSGIQRLRTEIWGWNDSDFALVDLAWHETDQRMHILWEANDKVDMGQLDEAVALYNEAIGNKLLLSYDGAEEDFYATNWQPIAQFAAFRLALIGYNSERYDHIAHTVNWMNQTYPDAVMTEAVNQLLVLNNEGTPKPEACRTITRFLQSSEDDLTLPIEYGYANPVLTVEDVCPVR